MKKKQWIADAILDTKKNTASIINESDEKDMYFKILETMHPKRFKVVKVKITIIRI